jgi:hypothetical protein
LSFTNHTPLLRGTRADQMPAFGIRWHPRSRRHNFGGYVGAKRSYSIEQLSAMADRCNTDLLAIMRCQLRQHLPIDFILVNRRS